MDSNSIQSLSDFIFYSVPFDVSTVAGFTGHLVSGFILGLSYLAITTTLASIFLSMGLYLRAFKSHYEAMFRNMDAIVAVGPLNSDRLIRLKTCLIEAINFHIQAKE